MDSVTTVPDQRRSSSPLAVHGPLAVMALLASIVLLVGGYIALAAKGGWLARTRPREIRLQDAVGLRGDSAWRGPLWAPTAGAGGLPLIRLTDHRLEPARVPTRRLASLGA